MPLRKRWIVPGLLLLWALLPQWPQIPVEGARARDWNPRTFWFEPWGRSGVHKGIDIFARPGTPVRSSSYGVVLFRGEIEQGGKVVVALGPRWRLHYYAHLHDIDIYPGQPLLAGTRLGSRVVVKAGAVIGGDGFGFVSGPHGHTRIPHIGGCVLEDDVEIGANCTIDRGSLDDTVIGQGTKLDNQVHVGHNVRIGRRCLVMGKVGIGGSTRIGDGVVVAGHSTLVDHVTVGDRARIGARSFVIGDVPAGSDVSGQPARPHRETLRAQAALRRLEPLVRDLERIVNEGGDGRG